MKRFIVYTIIIAGTIAVAVGCGGGNRNKGGADAAGRYVKSLTVAISDSLITHRGADTIDFGRVREGEHVVREFTLRNDGDIAMVITGIDLSCGCVEADYPKQPLKPGQEKTMTLTLDTRNLGGWIFKSAKMQTSLSSRPYVLYVTAEIE